MELHDQAEAVAETVAVIVRSILRSYFRVRMFHMPIDLQGGEIAGPVHRECESVVLVCKHSLPLETDI